MLAQTVTLVHCVWQVFGSDLSRDTGYSDWGFPWFFTASLYVKTVSQISPLPDHYITHSIFSLNAIVIGHMYFWGPVRVFVSYCFSYYDPCGGGLEYLHRNPASHKRWRKGNPVWNETVICCYGSFTTLNSEWCVLQNTDPSSHQRVRPTWRSKYMSD
jgi:hypothetical protein